MPSARTIVEEISRGRRMVTDGTRGLDWDRIRSEGPPPGLEEYCNAEGDEILCTEREREDCELDTGFSADSDTLDAAQWEALEGWLRANAGLSE